jgi:predicted O-methyltransferase YrrM
MLNNKELITGFVKVAAFNNDSIVSETVVQLVKDLHIDCIVETGTFRGTTTAFLSENFPTLDIYTIEVDFKTFLQAEHNLKSFKNIKLLCGSSEKVLEDLLPRLKDKRILFYLDAHWEKYWPLLDEFEAIRKNAKDNCCIVIDDFKVPYRQFQYDTYEKQPLDVDYIQEKMNEVYKTPFYFFNDRSTRESRAVGKIYIIPGEWREKVSVPLTQENGLYYVK